LKLDADWVVLSACNTAAGEKPGAEALSGLARAFFYAGARALLVSHWSVDSEAATRLATATFELMKSDPAIGRSQALRRAMLTYMNDPANADNAYPAFWGPFEVGSASRAERFAGVREHASNLRAIAVPRKCTSFQDCGCLDIPALCIIAMAAPIPCGVLPKMYPAP
jgi:hypothetical protein